MSHPDAKNYGLRIVRPGESRNDGDDQAESAAETPEARTPVVGADELLLQQAGKTSDAYRAVTDPSEAAHSVSLIQKKGKAVTTEVRKIMLMGSRLGAPNGLADEVTALWEACDVTVSAGHEGSRATADRVEFHRLFREYKETNQHFLRSLSSWLRLQNVRLGGPGIGLGDEEGWVVINASMELLNGPAPQVEVRKNGEKMTVDLFSIFCGIEF